MRPYHCFLKLLSCLTLNTGYTNGLFFVEFIELTDELFYDFLSIPASE